MPYAVLQVDLTPPTHEQLQRAFQRVPGLTAADAHILGQDAFGVLVKNFPAEHAAALQGALRTEGLETEIVDQAHLPQLPPAKQVKRVDCLPEHLLIYDPLGRSFPLPWVHVMLVAAGCVRLTQFVRQRTEYSVMRYDAHGGAYPDTQVEFSSREERNFHLLADIFIAGGSLRYSVNAADFNFAYLGERRTKDTPQDFHALLNDLAQYATNAKLTRGAEQFCEAKNITPYPTKNAFFEESVWTLWQMKKQS